MIAQPQKLPYLTASEYLAWEARQDERYEYVDGEIIAMTGGSIAHTKIYLNLYRALFAHLQQRDCEVYVADVKVQTKQGQRYFYPDLVVTCDPDDLRAKDFIQNPTVIVEVLSPGTAGYDRGKKFKSYRQLAQLQDYVLIDAEAIAVEVYQRSEGNVWQYTTAEAGDCLHLPSVDFTCAVADLYQGVAIAPEQDGV